MGEFFRDYGFFFLVAVLMLFCHMGHGGRGRKGRDDRDTGSGAGGHRH
jgi:hypothetical protein